MIPNICPHQKNIFPNRVPLRWLTTKNMKIWLSCRGQEEGGASKESQEDFMEYYAECEGDELT